MKQLNIALAAAVAALTFGMASQASAADVQIYGRIDAGLVYEHTDPGVGDATDKFTLDSGVGTASRFGLRGSEDLGNGYQVKFVLENGYKTDTGALSTANTIFDREATLQLVGPFGTISAGRSAILGTDGGASISWAASTPSARAWAASAIRASSLRRSIPPAATTSSRTAAPIWRASR